MYFSYEVTTTQKCDMACTYCFEGEELQNTSKQRSQEEIIKGVWDMLNSEEFNKIYEGVAINFWGGEPTQNTKMIVSLIAEFKDAKVNFFMYTNGFNLANIQKILNNFQLLVEDKSRFKYQVSYDGLSHDAERIDHKGSGTATKILENIRILRISHPSIDFKLKSTLPVNELPNIVKHWEHFKEIIDEMPEFGWSPTLEYTNKYNITEEFAEQVNSQFLILAKREIQYFKEHNRFVWNWFGTGERSTCSAGMNITNVDIDGNLLVCHGALYSENKEDFIIGHVKDSVPEQVLASHKKHKEIFGVPEHCKGCEATVCYQCPIINHDTSDKETYEERYHDPKDDLCLIYKAFGKIDRTVQRHLKI